MGSWSLTIHGHGIHDNGKEGDIDKLAEQFINDLKAKGGHVIDAVHLTVGSGRKYLAYDTLVSGLSVNSAPIKVEYF